MIKFKTFIYIVVILILTSLCGTFVALHQREHAQVKFQQKQIGELDSALQKALGQTAISFAITPTIQNKVTSAFGSTKNVTLQYYFTLDGKAIIAKPDSVYHIKKDYK
ncbi:MAG: hypothetical protein LBB53_01515 [Prevotellaceae bacterium]|jgi:hypothetical protein|nr:hypothetical protein [Prevotellaceae bacterium]